MLAFEEILERLKDILAKEVGDRKVYDKDVAKALGLRPEYLSMLKKRQKLPLQELLDFCAKRKININWFLYDQDPLSLCDETEKFAYVKYFKEINASAGGGAFNYELVSQKLYIDKEVVGLLGGRSSLKYIEALNVIGDSMEPELKEGSIVFVDTRKKDIKKGGIYLFFTNVGVFVKRVRLRTDKRIELISVNRNYPLEVIEPEGIEIVGQVVGSIEKIV